MNLESVLKLFVLPHVVAGSIALVLFWTAAVLRKGSTLHRRAGQIYLLAMLAIIVTGVPLVALAWLNGHEITATFLGYLLLLVTLTCRNAWCAIRFRRDPQRFGGRDLQLLVTLTGLAGIVVVLIGFSRQAWILVGFGMIGPVILIQTVGWLRERHRGAKLAPNWWLKEHYGAMIGNGIATHIAFFQVGLTRLFPQLETALLQNLAWFGPLLAAGIAAKWLNHRYRHGPPSARLAASK